MKKYFLSFSLIVAFTFYAAITNQNSPSVISSSGSASPAEPLANGTAGNGQAIAAGAGAGSAPPQTTTPVRAPKPKPSAGSTGSGTSGMGMGGGMMMGMYKNGTYSGPAADAYYGNVQVRAIIQGGKLADVQILQYPNDRGTSIEINQAALPQLVQEAIAAQSANVDIVSGATESSGAFQQSLGTALAMAKA